MSRIHSQSNTKRVGYMAHEFLRKKLNSEEDLVALNEIQNELVEKVIYRIMEMVDGGDLSFEVDLIDKETKLSLREGIQLHDKFMDYLYQNEVKKQKVNIILTQRKTIVEQHAAAAAPFIH
jgi:hypothetical protein